MRAMEQVSAPVVAIACILAAVFIPVAFLGGISGQIYRQFALTIAASVLLSAFSALSLSPALSALLLKPHKKSRGPLAFLFGDFNRAFEWTTNTYLAGVGLLDPALRLRDGCTGAFLGGGRLAVQETPDRVSAGRRPGRIFHARTPAGWRLHRPHRRRGREDRGTPLGR